MKRAWIVRPRQWQGMAIISPSRRIMGFIQMGHHTHVTALTNAYQVLIHLPFHHLHYLQCLLVRESASHDPLPLTCHSSILFPKARPRCILEATLNQRWTCWNLQAAQLHRMRPDSIPRSPLYTIFPEVPLAPHIERYITMFCCTPHSI